MAKFHSNGTADDRWHLSGSNPARSGVSAFFRSASVYVAVLVLASVGVVTAHEEISESSVPSSPSSEVESAAPVEALSPLLIALRQANAFLRTAHLDVHRQQAKIVDDIRALPKLGPVSPDAQSRNDAYCAQLRDPNAPGWKQLQEKFVPVLDEMLRFSPTLYERGAIRRTVLGLIADGEKSAHVADQVEPLYFVAYFVHKALLQGEAALSAEVFAFIPFLLRRFHPAAFACCPRVRNTDIILNLLLHYRLATDSDLAVDRTEWDRFMTADNSINARLCFVMTVVQSKSCSTMLKKTIGLSCKLDQLPNGVDLFIEMLPRAAREQIWLELRHYEIRKPWNRKLGEWARRRGVWSNSLEKHYWPVAHAGLVRSIYASSNLTAFLEKLYNAKNQMQRLDVDNKQQVDLLH